MSIAKSYNSWAASYDNNENKTRDLDRQVSQEVLKEYDFQLILELGCGTGKNTSWLLKKTEAMIALDFSIKMLEKAKEKIKSDKVDFRQADLKEDWNLGQQQPDLICCNLVLEHIEDLAEVFQKAAQALAPGGKFFCCELHPFKQYAGSKARFKTPNGEEEVLQVYVHDVSAYLDSAQKNGFQLLRLDEWWDEPRAGDIPRLISFLFVV